MGILYTSGLFIVKGAKELGLDKEIFLQDLWGSGTSGMSPVC